MELIHKKRKQVKNACVNCQKACKKCDDVRPCTRCIKYGLGDSCTDSVRKERKRGDDSCLVKRGWTPNPFSSMFKVVKRGPYRRKSSQEAMIAPAPGSQIDPVTGLPIVHSYYATGQNGNVPTPPHSADHTRVASNDHQSNSFCDESEENSDSELLEFYYSDEEILPKSQKLSVLASICSAVLDHSKISEHFATTHYEQSLATGMADRYESPFFRRHVSENHGIPYLDKESLEILSAPIKPQPVAKFNGLPDAGYALHNHLYHAAKAMRPMMQKPAGTIYPSYTVDTSYMNHTKYPSYLGGASTPIDPAAYSTPGAIIAQHYTFPQQNTTPQQPLTPPRSINDIMSYPHTPQKLKSDLPSTTQPTVQITQTQSPQTASNSPNEPHLPAPAPAPIPSVVH